VLEIELDAEHQSEALIVRGGVDRRKGWCGRGAVERQGVAAEAAEQYDFLADREEPDCAHRCDVVLRLDIEVARAEARNHDRHGAADLTTLADAAFHGEILEELIAAVERVGRRRVLEVAENRHVVALLRVVEAAGAEADITTGLRQRRKCKQQCDA